jgi:hypothetical protein
VAVWEGEGIVTGTINAIQKLLGALESEMKVCKRDSSAHFRTTQNADNLDPPACSLQYLINSTKGLQDALK